MDRRDFIKDSAMVMAAGSAMVIPGVNAAARMKDSHPASSYPSPRKGSGIAKDFKYNSDGSFKVLQLTDTHVVFGDQRSERAYENVDKMLQIEKPDLVIHTGDVIFGRPAEDSLRKVLGIIADHKIP